MSCSIVKVCICFLKLLAYLHCRLFQNRLASLCINILLEEICDKQIVLNLTQPFHTLSLSLKEDFI